uniref:Uncharacterized protein n=1 Tax=Electrophorus electricus TaxID=8005 RepID=A0A4W4GWC9_ELEEL
MRIKLAAEWIWASDIDRYYNTVGNNLLSRAGWRNITWVWPQHAWVTQDPKPGADSVGAVLTALFYILALLCWSFSPEIIPRDVSIKDKFIKHFTGPVKFSSECRLHFHRIYHNTRECGRPAYYKRCARLLTRLAMSPLCAQP